MFTQDVLGTRWKLWLPNKTPRIRKRPPILMSLTILLFLAMMLFVFGVVLTARAAPAPQLLDLDLPQAYLPGSPMPEDVFCYAMAYDASSDCSVNYQGNEVFLKFDTYTKTILRATIEAHGLTVGELIIAWGTPTEIVQTYYMTSVHWGIRSAYTYSDSFRPDNRVTFILYDLEPQRASPWRGFRRYRG